MLGHGGVCAQGVLDRHRTLELVLGQEPARKQSRLFLPFEEDVELIYQNLGEVEGRLVHVGDDRHFQPSRGRHSVRCER